MCVRVRVKLSEPMNVLFIFVISFHLFSSFVEYFREFFPQNLNFLLCYVNVWNRFEKNTFKILIE